jgi:hypothetical protein
MKPRVRQLPPSLLQFRNVAVSVVMLCLLGAGNVARADLAIYADSLADGWQDFSGGLASYQNTAPVHSGLYSIAVNTPNQVSLWYIINAGEVDTSSYSALNFWVYAQAGQLPLVVHGQADWTIQGSVILDSIVPDTWQQETISLSALGLDNRTDVTGILIQNVGFNVDAGTYLYLDDISLISAPEPGTVSFIAMGLAGAYLCRRKTRN